MTEKNITKLTIIIAITLFVVSLTQTAYCTNDCKSSLMVLLIGLLGILTEIGAIANFIFERLNGHSSSISNEIGATFIWLANPIIIFSIFIFYYNKRISLVFSIISTILILLFMAFDKVIDNEAGHYSKITELKLGYWLWLLSSVTILIGSLTILKLTKLNNERKNA
jgi:small-conductance mechanosensitive channel